MDNFRQAFDPDNKTPNRVFFAVDAVDSAEAESSVKSFLGVFGEDFLSYKAAHAFPMAFRGGMLKDELLIFFEELFSAGDVFSIAIPFGVEPGGFSANEIVAALVPKYNNRRLMEDILASAQDYIVDSLNWKDNSTGVRFYNVSEQSFSLSSLLMRKPEIQEKKWIVAMDICWNLDNFWSVGR